MQFTISLLPASLSLVHIPRSRVHTLSPPILRQILQPSQAFLNVTSNEIELSLFMDHSMLNDFQLIARRDRRKQRSQSVQISYERWSVLQIDSHSDGLGDSGARVHELSAPLAAAGISILYQSSYMSDFIFVKEARIKQVMSLLASAGFDLHPQDSNVLTSVSPPLSPISNDFASEIPLLQIDTSSFSILDNPLPSIEHVAESRNKSHSPLKGDVCLLDTDLVCVGLPDDSVDHWGLKIVKLLAFPELIPLSARKETQKSPLQNRLPPTPRGRSSLSPVSSSSSSDEEGYFSHSPAGNNSTSSLVTSTASRSHSDLTKRSTSASSASKHRIVPLPPLSPISDKKEPESPPFIDDLQPRTQSKSDAITRVPFFSFTRTPEGSSLTTDVSLLAALFPPHERHIVICSSELDAADDRDAGDTSDEEYPSSTMRCLQIDLRRFGLDKHGLVNRFSRVLEENGINHMYSSTFKTANLLVEKSQSLRAQSLLRSC